MTAGTPGHVVGVDGGGTHTRVAIADSTGRELIRRGGPAGLVDPRAPAAAAAVLTRLVREAAAEAGVSLPAAALCAGLAGAGDAALREAVRTALAADGVADRVAVVTDGVIALDGALEDEPGVLLVAGTGSVAYGRSEDGRVARCGGWGMVVGDEGSGYVIARTAIQAALQAADGRGPQTGLLPALLEAMGVADPAGIPAWVGRAGKGEVAALTPVVVARAEAGDAVADAVLAEAADGLARHVEALLARLGPWSAPVPVVFHGGVLGGARVARQVEARLARSATPVLRRPAVADAVTGAVRHALTL